MYKLSFRAVSFALTALLICTTAASGQELKPIKLLKPQLDSGKPLMQVLNERKSSREYSSRELPLQVLSNLLWAGFGINRADKGLRTAPSASNMQEIDIYVSTADGLYLYDAAAHLLQPVLAKDIRTQTGMQPFVGDAPINLIFVADYTKMRGSDDQKLTTSHADTGFISQNVYLYCASEGLATVVRGMVNRDPLAKVMGLSPDQHITYAQTVGYSK